MSTSMKFAAAESRWDTPRMPARREPPPAPAEITCDNRCLLVDDDLLLLNLLARTFRSHGYEVLTATTGREAVRIAQERRPDFVVLDIGLPGPDGLQVLTALRQLDATAGIPVIMLTARTGDEALISALNRGADDYVMKPIAPPELVARVLDILASRAD